MTKQEEIREGIAQYLYECDDGIFPDRTVIVKWEDAKDSDKQEYYSRADHILKGEDSQGVVIKVEGELPEEPDMGNKFCQPKMRGYIKRLKNAGYVAVELLIEEEQ